MTVVGPALSLYPSAVTSIRYNTAVIKYSYHYMIFYVTQLELFHTVCVPVVTI